MTLTTDVGDALRYPRLRYAAKFVFGQADVRVHYGQKPPDNAVFVPQKSDLLFQTGTRAVAPPHDLSDIFFAAFYFLTEYDCWSGVVGTDAHGRYRDAERRAVVNRRTDYPFLDEEILKLSNRNEGFELVPTLDIDGPWKYQHKPFWVRWGGMWKGDVANRLRVELGGRDPYDAWEKIRTFPSNTVLFWLLAGNTRYDVRYRTGQSAVRELLRTLEFEAGIHPSYNAAFSPQMLADETRALEDALGKPVKKSRMHFLRYRLPETYRALIAAGIHEEYTTCMPTLAGFKYGTARAFRWFDVESNEETPLWLVPTLWMDRTFLAYEKIDATTARSRALKLVERARSVGGRSAVLVHPPSLAGADEWKGWESLTHGLFG